MVTLRLRHEVLHRGADALAGLCRTPEQEHVPPIGRHRAVAETASRSGESEEGREVLEVHDPPRYRSIYVVVVVFRGGR